MRICLLEEGDQVNYPDPNQNSALKITVKDRYYIRYPSGRRFVRYLYSDLLEVLCEEMRSNIQQDLDNVVIIDGAEGSGKSSLAYNLAITFDPKFNITESYCLDLEDLVNKAHDSKAPPGTVFWFDEATAAVSNRDWMKNDNKTFIKILQMFRSRGWVLIMCIPDVRGTDVYLRENRVRYVLHTEWLEWEKSTNKNRGYFRLTRIDYKSTTGYRKEAVIGYGKFGKIPQEVENEYLTVKNDTQNEFLNEVYEKKNRNAEEKITAKANRKMLLFLRDEQGLSVSQIHEITGLAEQTISNRLSQARKEKGRGEL